MLYWLLIILGVIVLFALGQPALAVLLLLLVAGGEAFDRRRAAQREPAQAPVED